MRELFFDLRRGGLLIGAKALVIALLSVIVFNFISFSQSTDHAVGQSFSPAAGVELYGFADTLQGAEDFSNYRESLPRLNELGAFYNRVNTNGQFKFLSAFDQPVSVRDFSGDPTFDEGYGTEMTTTGPYFDEDMNGMVQNVKAMQLNQQAFNFYHLEAEDGPGIDWGSVNYDDRTLPVVLGDSYRGIYEVGQKLRASYYFEEFELVIAGFFPPGASMFFQGDINHFLDSYIVLPYPPVAEEIDSKDQYFWGILLFAMVNANIAADSMTVTQLLNEIGVVAAETGFRDYTILGTPEYLIQYNQFKQLVQSNLHLIALLVGVLTLTAMFVVGSISGVLYSRRVRSLKVQVYQGQSPSENRRVFASFIAVEYLFAAVAFWAVVVNLPNFDPGLLLSVTLGLAVFATGDVGLHRRALRSMVYN